MRESVHLFASSAALIAIALGLLLKADRYGPAKAPDFEAFATTIEANLQGAGWRRIAASPSVAETAYETLTFRHRACPKDLNVLILGYTADLAPLLRTRFSSNLTLVQNGKSVTAFNTRALQLQNLRNAIARTIGLEQGATPPLLALTPAADAIDRTCHQSPVPDLTKLLAPARQSAELRAAHPT